MPGPVHRLDRNTSGIVIFGKTLAALQNLNEMIKQRHCIEKIFNDLSRAIESSAKFTRIYGQVRESGSS